MAPDPMQQQDKTFSQALRELESRLGKALTGIVEARIELVRGHTVTSVTADVEDETLREFARDILIIVKILAFFDMLCEMAVLTQPEYDEIESRLWEWFDAAHPLPPGRT
jgi:hypothetical protein